ncbi:M56 family metallopeptidase [Tenacibaculum sp. SDUM215027]|uniref:M56 family metallopeptidase n=1 Tax=Tenacibaculum sp. SDUM215027 TaxID=3422596 RepID=UPI003D32038B
MINYIIQVVLFQVLFVAVYDFFLSKETFFNKNRWYLLSTALLSFMLPLFKIPTVQKAVPQEYYTLLPEVVLSPQKVIEKAAWYQSVNYLDVLFWIGCLLFFVVFLIKLERIVRLVLQYGVAKKENYKLVLLPKETKAFSFFNYIFLGNEIPSPKKEKIIQHELVHSEQKHTLDLLFFEFLKIVMWFNPMVYVYQNRISLVHEYISDAVASKSDKKENYINHLLADIFQVEHISFINQFYKHSLIKKRIIMMTKTQSKKIKQLKYLLLIPLLGTMLLYTACSESSESNEEVAKKELTTIYIQMGKEYQKEMVGKKETYLDFYQGTEIPGWEEISYNDLLAEEKLEYDEDFSNVKGKDDAYSKTVEFKLYKKPNGRKVIANIIDFSKIKNKSIDEENAPFALVEKVPTFPGCSEGDKDCFNKSMMKFVQENFDVSIAKNLDLKRGKKKIYIQFRVDKNGKVTDVNARAPHPTLKQHAEELVQKLPQMQPGEHNGKKVRVGYTLPITFNVE